MKGIYLFARLDRYCDFPSLIYNDINIKFDDEYYPFYCKDATTIDLEYFDYIIATPPCNYYSRANYRRETSEYALRTKYLLPWILKRCVDLDKPFIVENVLNDTLLPKEYDPYCIRFEFGGHTFWTNVIFDRSDLIPIKQDKQNVCREKRDGNINVHLIIQRFLEVVHAKYFHYKLLSRYWGKDYE